MLKPGQFWKQSSKARDEISNADSVCRITLGQAFNFHFPYVYKWFQNSWQEQCCKNKVYWLKEYWIWKVLSRIFNNLYTSFYLSTAETLVTRKQEWMTFVHWTPQHHQCSQSLILRRQRSHSLRRLSFLASLQLLGKLRVGAYCFLVIWFLRDRTGVQQGA